MRVIWKPFGQLKYRWPRKTVKLPKQIGRNIKWSCQRIRKGYCDYDLYAIDEWFLKIMPEMLREFKEIRTSSPVGENYPSQAVFLGEEEREQDIHDEWDRKLDRMIFLLGEMDVTSRTWQNPYEDAYFKAVKELTVGPIEAPDGSRLFLCSDLKDYPEYRELAEDYHAEEDHMYRYRMECKREFFELFSMHFYDLWD